jgi:hypothetical protein
MRVSIEEDAPEYLAAWDKVMSRTYGFMFNMFFAPKTVTDGYCACLFPLLAKLETEVDSSGYSAFDKRYISRVAELFWNVWMENNAERIRVREIPFTGGDEKFSGK